MTAASDIEPDIALRSRIEALQSDYVHCIDDDRLEDWPDFFTDDGCYRVITRENHELGLPVGVRLREDLLELVARGPDCHAERVGGIFEALAPRELHRQARLGGRESIQVLEDLLARARP